MAIQTIMPDMQENRGYLHDRTKWSALEKAFADHWEEENDVKSGRHHGHGLLQNLFFSTRANGWFAECTHIVSRKERYVAATVIQWLGTNCGFSFLCEVLRSQGLYIAEIPKHAPLPPDPPKRHWFSRKLGI